MFNIHSSAFQHKKDIPAKYTCQGEDVSPPLSWEEVPEGTETYALIMDDPDAPNDIFTHWLIFNIPVETTEVPEAIPTNGELSDGTRQGANDFGNTGYAGPCPSPGERHRYRFNFYALNKHLNLEGGTSKTQIIAAMEGAILDRYELIGMFER